MSRRRNNPPPFEVMTGTTPMPLNVARETGRGVDRGSLTEGWWARAKYPVVLRVPRGYMVLAVAALVGLIVLTYQVGRSRGYAKGAAEVRADYENQELMPPIGGFSTDDGPTAPGPAGKTPSTGAKQIAPTPAGARKIGLNYMVLARYPQDEARRLTTFLRGQGVDTMLDRLGDGRLHLVIAVNRGFTGSELSGEEFQAYKGQLQAIGRAWKLYNQGRGDALETMYPARYDGP